MKKGSTLLLKGTLGLIALAVLAICIFALPVGIRTDVTGYYRPILIGLYIPAIPFYIALYQSWLLLNLIDKHNAFSELAVKCLQKIKYCGLIISGLFILGMPFIFNAGDKDDAPGVVAIALVIIFASFVVATFAGLLQKLLKNAIDIKAENELTV